MKVRDEAVEAEARKQAADQAQIKAEPLDTGSEGERERLGHSKEDSFSTRYLMS